MKHVTPAVLLLAVGKELGVARGSLREIIQHPGIVTLSARTRWEELENATVAERVKRAREPPGG